MLKKEVRDNLGKNIKSSIVVYFIIFAASSVYGQDSSSFNIEETYGLERATWQFEFDNDVFFNKDNKLSSGWSLQKHSAVAGSWEGLEGVPGFVKRLGKNIPTLTAEKLFYRAGIAIGQVIQTPDDLSRSDLITDDVPYAGVLSLQATWYAFNDDEFRGFEITAGVAGPLSLAEQTQKTIHQLIDSADPKGWDNQISTEPVFNFNYMRKQKIWRRGNPAGFLFDTAINGNVGLGNLFTQASASLEMRFGYNMPGGFVYIPDPIGLSMHYRASLTPPDSSSSLYGSLVLRGTGFVHNIFLDGNTFSNSHDVAKEPFVAQAIAGLHYELENWSVHLNLVLTSDNVDTDQVPAAEGREKLGTIAIEWRP